MGFVSVVPLSRDCGVVMAYFDWLVSFVSIYVSGLCFELFLIEASTL